MTYFSLLEKTDLAITIKITTVSDGALYADSFELWMIYEIITPDIRSNQVAMRQTYRLKWIKKPIVYKLIKKEFKDGVKESNADLPQFLTEGVNYFK